MNENIKFYMQRIDIPNQPVKDLERDYPGMKYSKAKGIDTIGEARVYEEEYAESNQLRVYIPKVPLNKSTKVEITFFFLGENRRKTKELFDQYIRTGIHTYWDTKRKKMLTFYLKDKIETSEEQWYGNQPYIEVTYKLNNIYGKAENHGQ